VEGFEGVGTFVLDILRVLNSETMGGALLVTVVDVG
jgi:hypothetical protein